jgi:hypothetical protein
MEDSMVHKLWKLFLLSVVLIFLFSFFSYWLYPNKNKTDATRTWTENQAYIDAGKDLDDCMNRLGIVLVDYIEKRVAKIKEKEWKNLRLGDKLYLLLLFNRLDMDSPFNLEEFKNPLKLEIYRRLANAMGRAIENRDKLLKKTGILYFDVEKLKQVIAGTGKPIIDRKHRKQLGLLKAENAVYEIFLSVNRKDKKISIGGNIVTIETGNLLGFSDNYNIPAETLIDQYCKDIKPLEISKIYYQAPGTGKPIEIPHGATVEANGKIWFEIILPELGGYLLGYLKDSRGNTYNLFPGSRNAIINGDYRIPYNLGNPCTDIHETAAMNGITANLPMNRILIGGYTFDDKSGTEVFSFFYSAERNKMLEHIIKEAENIGKNIPKMKGVYPGADRFPADKKMSDPGLYQNVLELKFFHK